MKLEDESLNVSVLTVEVHSESALYVLLSANGPVGGVAAYTVTTSNYIDQRHSMTS
jgi:hypothetical protein